MAGKNSKEQKYADVLKALGIYDPAFDPAIHQLCVLERELSRAQKDWAASKPEGAKHADFTSALYPIILQLRKDIRASRDELGLTPKALKRLRGPTVPAAGTEPPAGSGNYSFAELLNAIKDSTEEPPNG